VGVHASDEFWAPRAGLVSLDVTIADPVPSQFFFRDTEGNRFLIVQPG
jgi:hypothetical protein